MNRPLSAGERAVIERLLSPEFRDVDYFRRQVPAIVVTHECPCGCGTIDFTVDRDKAPRAPSWDGGPDILVEGDAQSWLMLFQDDGWLTELEHVAGYGPNPEDLDPATIEPDPQVVDD
jgi:hypothetical protein